MEYGLFRMYEYFKIDISHWDMSNALVLDGMFECQSVFIHFDLENGLNQWDMKNVQSLDDMFAYCKCNLDLSDWKFSKDMNSIKGIFLNYQGEVKGLDNWDVSNIYNFDSAFSGTKNIGLHNTLKDWNICKDENVEISMKYMFSVCDMSNIDLSKWDMNRVSNTTGMFSRASNLQFDISNWKFDCLYVANEMFFCGEIPSGIQNMNLSNIQSMINIFAYTEIQNSGYKFIQDLNIPESLPINVGYRNYNKTVFFNDFFMPNINSKPTQEQIEIYDFIEEFIERHNSQLNRAINEDKKQNYEALRDKMLRFNPMNKLSSEEILQIYESYQPTSKEELNDMIKKTMDVYGNNCDLNWIDVSQIRDFSYLFSIENQQNENAWMFNGDISKWNFFSARDMSSMFAGNYEMSHPISMTIREDCNTENMFYKSSIREDMQMIKRKAVNS